MGIWDLQCLRTEEHLYAFCPPGWIYDLQSIHQDVPVRNCSIGYLQPKILSHVQQIYSVHFIAHVICMYQGIRFTTETK